MEDVILGSSYFLPAAAFGALAFYLRDLRPAPKHPNRIAVTAEDYLKEGMYLEDLPARTLDTNDEYNATWRRMQDQDSYNPIEKLNAVRGAFVQQQELSTGRMYERFFRPNVGFPSYSSDMKPDIVAVMPGTQLATVFDARYSNTQPRMGNRLAQGQPRGVAVVDWEPFNSLKYQKWPVREMRLAGKGPGDY